MLRLDIRAGGKILGEAADWTCYELVFVGCEGDEGDEADCEEGPGYGDSQFLFAVEFAGLGD